MKGHGLLEGKVVVVTAAAGTGIGGAAARRCLEEGAQVAISDQHHKRLAATRDELAAGHGDGVWSLERDPLPLETSMPRVLAVGDARHGSVKRVASAVGAGSIAIRVVHRLLEADDASAPVDKLVELRPA